MSSPLNAPYRALWRLQGRDGFTLIEVLIAFAVMGMLLSVLYRAVVTIHLGSNTVSGHAHCALVARAVLEETFTRRKALAGLASGLRDGCRWTTIATPIDLSPQISNAFLSTSPTPAQVEDRKALWTPQRLSLRVETSGRPIEIETVRLVRLE
jgi:prepilin-type N-terminal cleavage/methylation domain-containing protein